MSSKKEDLSSWKYLYPLVYFKKLFGKEERSQGEWEVMWKFYGLSIIFWLIVPLLIIGNFLWFDLTFLIGTILWVVVAYFLGYITIVKHQSMIKHKKEEKRPRSKKIVAISFLLTLLMAGLITYIIVLILPSDLSWLNLPGIFGKSLTNTREGKYILIYGLGLIISVAIVSLINNWLEK